MSTETHDNPIPIRGVTFGERHGDNSGWWWRVALLPCVDGPQVQIEAGAGEVMFSPHEINPRVLAAALNSVADVLGFDKLPGNPS